MEIVTTGSFWKALLTVVLHVYFISEHGKNSSQALYFPVPYTYSELLLSPEKLDFEILLHEPPRNNQNPPGPIQGE